jgi:hypothetical protein
MEEIPVQETIVEEPKMAGLPLDLLQAVVEYLKTKPYVEVDPIIQAINANAKIIKITPPPSI